MNDQERGAEIIQAVYKASLRALFAIGVKSPDYVESFSLHFTNALDREFLKIGLFQPNDAPKQTNSEPSGPVEAPLKNLDEPIADLRLMTVVRLRLQKAGIKTVGDLMNYMQKEPLTSIVGVKEKSAKHILEKLKLWNS